MILFGNLFEHYSFGKFYKLFVLTQFGLLFNVPFFSLLFALWSFKVLYFRPSLFSHYGVALKSYQLFFAENLLFPGRVNVGNLKCLSTVSFPQVVGSHSLENRAVSGIENCLSASCWYYKMTISNRIYFSHGISFSKLLTSLRPQFHCCTGRYF